MRTNWKRVCEKLKSESASPYREEKEVLLRIEKNIYHRKTSSPIVIAEVSNNYIKGHMGTSGFVLCREVVIFLEVSMYSTI